MPIVGDAKKVHDAMMETYKGKGGKEKAERIFYATANKQGRKAENWKKKSAAEKLAVILDGVPDLELLRQMAAEGRSDNEISAAVGRMTAGTPPKRQKKRRKLAALLDQIPDGGALKQNEVPGGLADGKPDQQFPQDQLQEGQETEAEEHGGTPGIARDIAKDHLTEDPKYYDHLEKMEQLGSRIMKVSALVPQRVPGVGGVEGPLKLVDQQTGQPPGMAAAAPAAGKPTTPQVAATQPVGAPPQAPPAVPGAPAQVPPPMPKAAAEIRARLAAVRVRAIMAEV